MSYTLQFQKEDNLAVELTAGDSSGTLTAGNFANDTRAILVVDYDNVKAEVIQCTISGTALTSITRGVDGTSDQTHAANAPVIMAVVPTHYDEVKFPVGMLAPYAGGSAPGGWLLCDGSAVSRTTYSELFAIIGTLYGTGNGSTTFNVPDLRGKIPVGLNASDTDFDTLGKAGGAKTSSVAHTHAGAAHVHAITDHAHHNGGQAAFSGIGGVERNGTGAEGHWSLVDDTGGMTGGVNSGGASATTTGGMSANSTPSTVQPYQAVNYIIKT